MCFLESWAISQDVSYLENDFIQAFRNSIDHYQSSHSKKDENQKKLIDVKALSWLPTPPLFPLFH